MKYKVMDENAETIVKGAMECVGILFELDSETVEYMLIGFDGYLEWRKNNDDHMPDLTQEFLFNSFYTFYYGFVKGGEYLQKISENSEMTDEVINKFKRNDNK
ncbi:hypothetical protein [Nitrosomonas sp.]|uniref:hypothetical protein n=1 Tax=Nitrosomonas sp. TaxID=42353 RepID=UPI00248E3007|nr:MULTISPECIES: hypothetical protein [Nitrosomonas]MCW5600425.1 hypothetical protein [Nitrosomonas sp.]